MRIFLDDLLRMEPDIDLKDGTMPEILHLNVKFPSQLFSRRRRTKEISIPWVQAAEITYERFYKLLVSNQN